MKSVITKTGLPYIDRQQSTVQDNFQRFLGLEVRTWEVEMSPAVGIHAATGGKLHDLAPGEYYAAFVTSLRNGSPIASRANATKYFATPQERETYIAARKASYLKKVASK